MAWVATAKAESPGVEMANAAKHFVAALNPEQKDRAVFAWEDAERFNWHFVPKERRGLPFKEMTPAQRQLAQALLASGLSRRGHIQVVTIMSLEAVLQDLEGGGRRFSRDPELYYVSIFGLPGPESTWGWRIEGHHVSIHITVVEGKQISATPSFLGANPAEVKEGPRKGLRVLAAEEDLARQLAQSLSAAQKALAMIAAEAPADIISGVARKAEPLQPQGLRASLLSPAQEEVLWQLISQYVHRHRPEVADQDLRKIEGAGVEKVYFAWAGSLEKGRGHYYRIQGPTFLMEYDCTQNDANHIHTVWRDFENDFGEDLLRRHYQREPHPDRNE